jgi:hypothetical protein
MAQGMTHDVDDWGDNPADRAGIIAHLSAHPEHARRYPSGFTTVGTSGLELAVIHRRYHEDGMADQQVERPEEPNVNDPPSPQADLLERVTDLAAETDLIITGPVIDGYSATVTVTDLPRLLNRHFLVTCRPLPDPPPDLAAEVADPVVVAEKLAILAQQIDDITGAGWDKSVAAATWILRSCRP